MTKTFPILPDLTCPELAGYKLPEVERHPIAIEVEMVIEVEPNTGVEMGEFPATHPDGTVKGR